MGVRVTVDVDLDDFYYELDSWDKEQLIELLEDDGLVNRSPNMDKMSQTSSSYEFGRACVKISQSYYRMSNEDVEEVMRIMKKYEFF